MEITKRQKDILCQIIEEYAETASPVGSVMLSKLFGVSPATIRAEMAKLEGLGLIPFETVRFKLDDTNLKVPHMGWDIVEFKQQNPLLDGLTGRQRYYFVHSYHAVCDSPENVLMTCDYGYEFACSVVRDNIYGVQFHPEKSHDFGMALLENFVNRC